MKVVLCWLFGHQWTHQIDWAAINTSPFYWKCHRCGTTTPVEQENESDEP